MTENEKAYVARLRAKIERQAKEIEALKADRDKWKACAKSYDITNPSGPVLDFLAKRRTAKATSETTKDTKGE